MKGENSSARAGSASGEGPIMQTPRHYGEKKSDVCRVFAAQEGKTGRTQSLRDGSALGKEGEPRGKISQQKRRRKDLSSNCSPSPTSVESFRMSLHLDIVRPS